MFLFFRLPLQVEEKLLLLKLLNNKLKVPLLKFKLNLDNCVDGI